MKKLSNALFNPPSNNLVGASLKLSINTNGGKSKSISYYSELYTHHEIYQKNNDYIITKIKEQPYYQKILQRYM